MRKIVLIAGALVLGLSVPAYAGSCPRLSKEVGAALGSSTMSAAVKAQAMSLREKGDGLHSSGRHGDSVAAHKQALALLGK